MNKGVHHTDVSIICHKKMLWKWNINIMDYKINKILCLLVLSLCIKVWKLIVYLKNICQIHPNTPIKYKYKYKYSRDPLYHGSVYHGFQYSTIGSWLPKFVKQIVDPSRERNIKSVPVRVIITWKSVTTREFTVAPTSQLRLPTVLPSYVSSSPSFDMTQ